jgi:hypothetical protein
VVRTTGLYGGATCTVDLCGDAGRSRTAGTLPSLLPSSFSSSTERIRAGAGAATVPTTKYGVLTPPVGEGVGGGK